MPRNAKDKQKSKSPAAAKPATNESAINGSTIRDLRVRKSEADNVKGGLMKGPEPLR